MRCVLKRHLPDSGLPDLPSGDVKRCDGDMMSIYATMPVVSEEEAC